MAEASPSTTPAAQKPPATTAGPAKPSTTGMSNAPFRITQLQHKEPWLKIMVYGRHGSGKTELLGSAADCSQMNDVIMLNAESGDVTLQDNPNLKNADSISVVQVESMKQAAFFYDWLKVHCVARDANDELKLKQLESYAFGIPINEIIKPKRFRTCIIDSLAEIEALSTKAILDWDEDKVMKDTDELTVAGWPEFRKNFESIKLFCRRFRDLPMHCLFACPEAYTKDELGKMHYSPYLTGKLSTQVQGFVDVVGYLVVGPQKENEAFAVRRLYLQPINMSPRFDAKCRLQGKGISAPYIDIPPGRGMETILKAAGLYKQQ